MEAAASSFNINSKRIIALVIIIIFIAGTVLLQSGIDNGRAELGLSSNCIKSDSSTLFKLLGGLRTALAAFLWIKIDRIHDGYYGDLSKEDELIPLYRIVTWLNPHLEDAYYVGSYLLYSKKQPGEGWKFAQEGLRLNPESSKMELNIGEIALFYRHDYKTAIYHLKRSFALAKDDEDKMLTLQRLHAAYIKANMQDKAEAAANTLAAIMKNHPSLSTLKKEDD